MEAQVTKQRKRLKSLKVRKINDKIQEYFINKGLRWTLLIQFAVESGMLSCPSMQAHSLVPK